MVKQSVLLRHRKAVKTVARCHRRVVNLRRNFLNKQANHYISRYQEIHVEDLKVSSLTIEDSIASWADSQKGAPKGTSQKCSGCGARVAKTLAVQVHRCHACGLVLDRDKNAALNILAG